MAKEQAFLSNGSMADGIAFARELFLDNFEYLMGTVHVWVWRHGANGVEVLLQKRSMVKKSHPGMLDISAAGHIDVGETSLQTAKRETQEEIGLVVDEKKLDFVMRIRKSNVANVIATVYLYEVTVEFTPVFHDGEVEACQWVGVRELAGMLANPEEYSFANHGKGYFTVLLDRLYGL